MCLQNAQMASSIVRNSCGVYTFWNFAVILLRMGCTLYRGSYPDWFVGTRVSLLFRCSIVRMATNLSLDMPIDHVIGMNYWRRPAVVPYVWFVQKTHMYYNCKKYFYFLETHFFPLAMNCFWFQRSFLFLLLYLLFQISVCPILNNSENLIVKKQTEKVKWRTVKVWV
jgi:hypothetical protein